MRLQMYDEMPIKRTGYNVIILNKGTNGMKNDDRNQYKGMLHLTRTNRAMVSRLRMLRRYKGDPKRPNIIHLAITDKCNMSCKFCLYKKDNKNFKVIDADRACSLINEINSPIILISGGEPLLGGDILKTTRRVADMCRKSGKITGVLTNGITLKKIIMQDYDEFKRGSKFFFQISVDGLKEAHDSLRGHFDLIMDNVQYAKEAGHLIYTNTVVSKSNINSLDEIVRFIAGFSNRIYLNPMLGSENGLDEEELKTLGRYIIDHQDIMIGNSINYGKFLTGKRELKCLFHSLVSITPSGRLKLPCYCYEEGAEYVDSFSEYLEKVGEQKSHFENRQAQQCSNCYTHCLHESDVYARYYLNEILEQVKRPWGAYKKYIEPLFKSLS